MAKAVKRVKKQKRGSIALTYTIHPKCAFPTKKIIGEAIAYVLNNTKNLRALSNFKVRRGSVDID